MRKRMMQKPKRRRSRRAGWAIRFAPVAVATVLALPFVMSDRNTQQAPVPLAVLGVEINSAGSTARARPTQLPDGSDEVRVGKVISVAQRLADPNGFVASAVINARASLTASAQLEAARVAAAAQKPVIIPKPVHLAASLLRPTALTRPLGPATSPRPATTPKTTVKSVTTVAPPPVAVVTTYYTPAQVEQIIRAVWPASIADRALAIAWRESGLNPRARNWCCTGLFQIYAAANGATLVALGYRADQLTDPAVNARVAYALYLRSGWSPWA